MCAPARLLFGTSLCALVCSGGLPGPFLLQVCPLQAHNITFPAHRRAQALTLHTAEPGPLHCHLTAALSGLKIKSHARLLHMAASKRPPLCTQACPLPSSPPFPTRNQQSEWQEPTWTSPLRLPSSSSSNFRPWTWQPTRLAFPLTCNTPPGPSAPSQSRTEQAPWDVQIQQQRAAPLQT